MVLTSTAQPYRIAAAIIRIRFFFIRTQGLAGLRVKN